MSNANNDAEDAVTEEEQVDAEVECPVCMKLLVDATSTPCGHTFCKFCLDESFMRKSSCPLCRLQINEEDCKDDRILRKMIDKLYPRTMILRREELRRAVEDDDHEYWQRKVSSIHEALGEGQADRPAEERNSTYIIWQNPSFSMPCPGEEEDIYFENPYLAGLVDIIFRGSLYGFVLLTWDLRDSAEMIGVMIRVTYFTLLSPSSTIREASDEWVPPRLKLQRARFRDNKIELYPRARHSCVAKGKCLGRVKIAKLQCIEDGECKGICRGLASAVCELNVPNKAETVRLNALVLRNQIQNLRDDIGQAGRLLYNRRFGDLPAVPARCGISQLEDVSFALMMPLAIPAKQKNEMIRSSTTEQRLQCLIKLIQTSGSSLIRMGLTQSTNAEWLSRIILGGWNQSIVLFFILGIGLAIVRWSDSIMRM